MDFRTVWEQRSDVGPHLSCQLPSSRGYVTLNPTSDGEQEGETHGLFDKAETRPLKTASGLEFTCVLEELYDYM
ncbi:hypothetical protein PG997_012575 [Apiospora hydei]|uniref:Uncharacterized protein n=1 Tax=Apiospora hydei TaxID=1337664 RepID=A0ABR1V3T9_9PEZI